MSQSKSMKSKRVNVLPKYRGMTSEEIKAAIPRYPVAVGAFSVRYDINIGVILRNCNAFACQHFVQIGHKKYDRRPSMGVQNYENIVHVEDTEALRNWLRANKYPLVAVDYIPGQSVPISDVQVYPANALLLLGSERNGIPEELLQEADLIVHIPMYGSVRSLNVGVASGIILNHWHETYARQQANNV